MGKPKRDRDRPDPNKKRKDKRDFDPAEAPRVQIDAAGERELINLGIRNASQNLDKVPGQFWLRAKAEIKGELNLISEAIREYHIDMIERVLTITNKYRGRELERSSRPLTEEEIAAALVFIKRTEHGA